MIPTPAFIITALANPIAEELGGITLHEDAACVAVHIGIVVWWLHQFLLREIDCIVMCSCNECSNNRQADHKQDEAGEG